MSQEKLDTLRYTKDFINRNANVCFLCFNFLTFFQVPFGAAFLEELRVAMDVANNERILKSDQSIYSRSRNSLASIDSIRTDSELENSLESD